MPRSVRFLGMMISVALAIVLGPAAAQSESGQNGSAPKTRALAVVVNPKNRTTDLTSSELRAYFQLDRQFWDDTRAVLYLRPSRSPEMRILLAHVYQRTNAELRKFWLGRVFRGEIPGKPAIAPTLKAALARVRAKEGAFTVVLADKIPTGGGVRVLSIDGKRPGDPDYPLVTTSSPKQAEPETD